MNTYTTQPLVRLYRQAYTNPATFCTHVDTLLWAQTYDQKYTRFYPLVDTDVEGRVHVQVMSQVRTQVLATLQAVYA